jgi:hypothetical protein
MISVSATGASLAAAYSVVAIAAIGCSDDSTPREPSSTPGEQAVAGHDGPSAQADRDAEVSEAGGAWFYVLPREREPTATAPLRGCVKRAPQPPGVTVRRIAPEKVLVTYRIPDGDEDCRAEWIQLTADVSDDFLGGDGERFPIPEERAGQIVLPLTEHVADADILVASTRTEENSGFASRTTTIRIR